VSDVDVYKYSFFPNMRNVKLCTTSVVVISLLVHNVQRNAIMFIVMHKTNS
jgi:hypothetical protein